VYISVGENQSYNKTDISLHCTEQVLAIFAIQPETKACKLIILSMHSTPFADIN
jgi:hypothetical protein